MLRQGPINLPFIHSFYPNDLWAVGAEVSFDPLFEGDVAGRTANARAVQADSCDTLGGDLDEFEVSTIRLHTWADELKNAGHLFVCGLGDGRGHAG